jgi:hypothetical protein
MKKDLDIKCWEGQHMKWVLYLGIPILAFWVIGIPLYAFILLFKNRKVLDEFNMSSKYRMLYQGFKPQFYYWEFINIIRKTILVSVNAFLALYPDIFRALLSLMILTILMRMQTTFKPYKNPVINALASREQICMIITFFGALFYSFMDYINPAI